MDFVILGPLEVVEGGRSLALGGPRQRALLAVLLIHRNEPVSRDRLIDALWGESPPPTVDQTLDTYVSRLRKLLGSDRIERRGGGYALRVEPDELDLDRFERLAAAGRLADALAVWRGPAFGDLLFEPFAAREAELLEERRLDVIEERMDAELASGGGAELAGELERLVLDHPLRERLVGQLMLTLYRAGRQSAALETYRRARRSLSEQLGLEPGPHLQELERRILDHDPKLGRPKAGSKATPQRPHRKIFLAAVVVAAGAAAIGAVLALQASSKPSAVSVAASRLVAVKATSARVGHVAAFPAIPAAMAAYAGSLWVADPNGEAVYRADETTGAVVDKIPIEGEPGSVVAGGGAVWVETTLSGVIERIDPSTEQITETIHLGQELSSGIAWSHGALWVADTSDGAVIELDPASGTAKRTISLDARPTSLVVGNRALWVADQAAGEVLEVDLTSGQVVDTIHVGNSPVALELDSSGLWVANSIDSTVTRIDPVTGVTAATIPVGSGPVALAPTGNGVWVANQYSGTLTLLDRDRSAVARTVHVGGQPTAVVSAANQVWVGSGPAATSHRGGTLFLTSAGIQGSIDPAQYANAPVPEFMGLAYDGLLGYDESGGPAGLRLVPDLAVQVPQATDGGKSYVFRLRPGIRYSTGRTVHASDFRRAIERLFATDSPGSDNYRALLGSDACIARRTTCDLARGIETDDVAGTVVFHLSAPDPSFPYELTAQAFDAPVPPGTPNHDMADTPLPGTGPYMITRANRHEVLFRRNPYFREWSHAAQPAGNPDTILWRVSPSTNASIKSVESGKEDFTYDLISPSVLRAIRTRSPGLIRSNPMFAIEFLHLNTNIAPFNDIRVRRALNLAIDRKKIAAMYGGALVAVPACQPLVPGLIGYRRYCPYTRDPTTNGAYRGPDLASARRLVAVSGTQGERIDVWGIPDEGYVPAGITAYVGHVLRSLGYRVRIHLEHFASVTLAERRNRQIGTDGDWLPDFPSPSAYFPSFFECGGSHGNGYECDPALDREINKAEAAELPDPKRAATLWTRIDREVTDRAYWVPTVATRVLELTSPRVHNYEFQPAYGGFIADQAWIR